VSATGRKPAKSEWLGLKFHLRGLNLSHDLELHLGKDAYLGLSRIERSKVNACGLFRKRHALSAPKEALPFVYLEACGMKYLLERFSMSDVIADSVTGIAALSYHRREAADKERFAIGDQAGLIPPFTGNGMSIAFESAALSLGPLMAWYEGKTSWGEACQQLRQSQQRTFSKRKRMARLLHPWLYRPGGQRVLSLFAKSRLLPFNALFTLTH